jgi:glutamate 5-kinase
MNNSCEAGGNMDVYIYLLTVLFIAGLATIVRFFGGEGLIAVLNQEGVEIARGVVNYSHEEIVLIAGKKTSEIEKILGSKDYDEIIHRNNLWVE